MYYCHTLEFAKYMIVIQSVGFGCISTLTSNRSKRMFWSKWWILEMDGDANETNFHSFIVWQRWRTFLLVTQQMKIRTTQYFHERHIFKITNEPKLGVQVVNIFHQSNAFTKSLIKIGSCVWISLLPKQKLWVIFNRRHSCKLYMTLTLSCLKTN